MLLFLGTPSSWLNIIELEPVLSTMEHILATRQQQQRLPSTIHQLIEVDDSYIYPAARVPSDSCTILVFPRGLPWDFQGFTILAHGLPRRSHGVFMSFSAPVDLLWDSRDSRGFVALSSNCHGCSTPMRLPWVSHESLVGLPSDSCGTHGSPMGLPSVSRGSPIGLPQNFHRFSMLHHGSPMSLPCSSRGTSVGERWHSNGFCMLAHGLPIGLP